jgi:small redox-active disulfide protein 2
MLNVKVLGSGCPNCKRLEATVRKVAEARKLTMEIEKVTDYAEIMQWPILSTPGLVVNGKLVSEDEFPAKRKSLTGWLSKPEVVQHAFFACKTFGLLNGGKASEMSRPFSVDDPPAVGWPRHWNCGYSGCSLVCSL